MGKNRATSHSYETCHDYNDTTYKLVVTIKLVVLTIKLLPGKTIKTSSLL